MGCAHFAKNLKKLINMYSLCNTIKELWGKCADRLNLPILKKLSWKEIHIGIDDTTLKTEQ